MRVRSTLHSARGQTPLPIHAPVRKSHRLFPLNRNQPLPESVFIGFLARSGLEILSAHPKLYWRDDCRPGSVWLRLTRKRLPSDRPWTGADEETSFPSWLALPGRHNLGMGRHWHFFCATFWVLNGLVYVILLFGTGDLSAAR